MFVVRRLQRCRFELLFAVQLILVHEPGWLLLELVVELVQRLVHALQPHVVRVYVHEPGGVFLEWRL
jgi:hypothetical protein